VAKGACINIPKRDNTVTRMSQNKNLTPDADVQNGCVFQETSDEKVFTHNSTGLLSCFNLTCLRMLHVLGMAKAGAL
jgi:hypothetical protein